MSNEGCNKQIRVKMYKKKTKKKKQKVLPPHMQPPLGTFHLANAKQRCTFAETVSPRSHAKPLANFTLNQHLMSH